MRPCPTSRPPSRATPTAPSTSTSPAPASALCPARGLVYPDDAAHARRLSRYLPAALLLANAPLVTTLLDLPADPYVYLLTLLAIFFYALQLPDLLILVTNLRTHLLAARTYARLHDAAPPTHRHPSIQSP
jgi:hypothetical protein